MTPISENLKLPVNAEMIRAARTRIEKYVLHTPLEYSYTLSEKTGANVSLKLESLQKSGSFKPRISFSKLLSLDEETRRRGAIASTAGGHGIGLSHAGKILGVPVDIYLPRAADRRKVELIERNGARLTYFDSVEAARAAAVEDAGEQGKTFVSAYNDPQIIAGSGTIGLEILDDLPETDLVLVGMGGGGIACGISIALKDANPHAEVWGVQSEENGVLVEWLRAGKQFDVETGPSIAEGLGAHIETDSITFPLAQKYVDDTLLVAEEEIKDAMLWALEEHQYVIEPSGAAQIAALDKLPPGKFKNIVIVVTGRNISRERYLSVLESRLSASNTGLGK
ncbi:MAG TPA: pyridoxal-phosphate dependent enzyme [Pyrinomonadaceae bacterium]|jgi:threonine dehydratase